MTARLNALTVVLEQDIREDDAEELISAIRMLRGVLSVESHVADHASRVAQQRARFDLEQKLWKVIHPEDRT